jgi:hypothetical protein
MTHIDQLRLAFERRYPIVKKRFQQPIPPMQAYLAIPIKTRLILLALHDGADEAAVKAALPYAKQTDVRLTSKEIREGLDLLKRGLEEPTFFIDLGQVPLETDHDGDLTDPTTKALCRDQDIPETVEKTFRQVWYPSAAPLLIGPMVSVELADWPLKMRLAIYCLVVAELEREEVRELLGCSAWYVRRCIEVAVKEFEPEITHAQT